MNRHYFLLHYLYFSSDWNINRNCGIKKAIHEKCHHDIIYGTLSFNVPLPSPYYGEIWDYKHANTENIQKAISMFDSHKAFKNKIQMKWLGYQLIHCVKSVQIRSYFWSECGKIRTRNYSVFGHFSRSDTLIFSKTSFRINV